MSTSPISKDLLQKSSDYVMKFFEDKVSSDYAYHNFEHTSKVVDAARVIGKHSNLDQLSLDIIILAALFHDTGIHKGLKNHESESVQLMRSFLSKQDVDEEIVKRIEACILATKLPQNPSSVVEKVMVDADLYHMSSYAYFSEWELMKREHESIHDEKIDDLEWLKENMKFFKEHTYFTDYGKDVLQKEKEKNYSTIKKRLKWINAKDKKIKVLEKQLEKMTIKASADLKPDKARETMLRITSRSHLELSTMADSKANIMISINSIILSIVVSVLIRKLEESPFLIIPAIILTLVCLMTIVFSVLATRPKLSTGRFKDEDVVNKKTNLLFFGNYHRMSLDNYVWGMKEMLKDPEYLYGSMIKDIHSLGVILGKKYRLLRIAYTIFMFGFVIAILSFVLAYFIQTFID